MPAAALSDTAVIHAQQPQRALPPEPVGERRGSGLEGQAAEAGDDVLIAQVRASQPAAFGELFHRYGGIALYVAMREADNPSDAEDIVGEAFASVFQALKEGGGPRQSFRGYLLSIVRRMAHRRNIQARRACPMRFPLPEDIGNNHSGLEVDETAVLIQVLRSLPHRWQSVLWFSEVEAMKPAQIAELMGITPNAVSALSVRARKALRRAYLEASVMP
ncbi:RNA polymerase sigma factor [Paenarthrobacter sp. JL.01a]|uniref:RNA polymerase sigma factor n=1 Tax=Paenarthrobacter sp. JL.01a TaxID=2979324 RepID=UPI0021C881A8|nr:sigma-70 family RNA polymerase sigma factor [Paenarthrobacter sp. JL.01a]UXM89909.1 sigma-70 family RNA polymerase sigma factor [Paenarthrobacter sp. JL.01a]